MSISQHHTGTNLLQALAHEMMKLMKEKQPAEQPDRMNAYAYFAGITPTTFESISSQSGICCVVHSDVGSWTVDTGASDYMTSNPASFTKFKPLNKPIHATLPNGTLQYVT